ncbi:cytosolic endo-beta-N-acetylglucosaminidase isoform X2 [Drosophila kikkawai]|uniref:Cytosolic endo-beta-N-acetylglucosaminidase isoform X2 n=1 Tax=Drosophila kikkawai TaxID=30033 RepID=A0A6P4J1W2_DROKI|nr:cytosolic endo-beta-N-acetylglucosaminidase isoform X2 [Drosophila kikkawai]
MEQAQANEHLTLGEQLKGQGGNTDNAGNLVAAEAEEPANESWKNASQRSIICQEESISQLEAEAIKDNRQLLGFQVRSRNIDWRRFVQPLDTSVRSEAVYLGRQADLLYSPRRPVTEENRRELLVCHDMMGNYLEDRHFHSSEKYDDYRFQHWSAVDYFCYFSHNYVTIPPSGWLNAAHRHGVPVLGTFIVEAPGPLDEVLASEESVSRTVAALTRLCLHFGFEGWLVNVEVTVPQRNMPNLYRFVRELTSNTESRVPHGRVFWYDSVTESGDLNWQNELNARNAEFFRRSHGTLINYAWSDQHLDRSARQVEQEGSQRRRVFMGLDVFGRSRKGGFHTMESMDKIAGMGFSAGIFAPGWSFETLRTYGYNIKNSRGDEQTNSAFLARNEAWWARIWPALATHPYRSLPFYTDFCVGSGRRSYDCGASDSGRSFFNLSRQSLQPSVPLDKNAVHDFETAFSGSCSLLVANYERAFRLFVTDFTLTRGVLLLGYAYKFGGAGSEDHVFEMVVRVTPLRRNDRLKEELYLVCREHNGWTLAPHRCVLYPVEEPLPPGIVHAKLPQQAGRQGEGWHVRYFLAKFDGPVRVEDIGVMCHRPPGSKAEAHLGAVFVEGPTLEDWAATRSQRKEEVDVYRQNMWKRSPVGN